MTFADLAIQFNQKLRYKGPPLPAGVRIMNPFAGSKRTMPIVRAFYHKYYDDHQSRHLILGINPGRFGAALTGIPFTDPKRLVNVCGIEYDGPPAHEPSSVFIYEMISAYGGADLFYKDFYINSICPLGFTKTGDNGREKNYNYYDSKELSDRVGEFILDNLRTLTSMPISRDICFCFGTGKNEKYLNQINDQHKYFVKIIALEHPRYVMQYRAKRKTFYIEKYINAFHSIKQH
jgi:hypothetical protein